MTPRSTDARWWTKSARPVHLAGCGWLGVTAGLLLAVSRCDLIAPCSAAQAFSVNARQFCESCSQCVLDSECHDRASSHTACPELVLIRGRQIHRISLLFCSRSLVRSCCTIVRAENSAVRRQSDFNRKRELQGPYQKHGTSSYSLSRHTTSAKVAQLSHLGLRLYTEPTRRGHGSHTMAMRT